MIWSKNKNKMIIKISLVKINKINKSHKKTQILIIKKKMIKLRLFLNNQFKNQFNQIKINKILMIITKDIMNLCLFFKNHKKKV